MEEIKKNAKIMFRKLWGSINKDNQHLTTEKIEDLIDSIIDLAVSKERDDFVKKMLSLPAKFWDDSDHSVGGYISKKDLKELLQTLINTK